MSDKLYFDEQNIQTAMRKLNIMGYNKVRVLIHPDLASYAPEGMNCILCDELPHRTVRISGDTRTAPWWTREWDKDSFRSYLDRAGKMYQIIHDELCEADFSGKDAGALYDVFRYQISPARKRRNIFTPVMFNGYDWDEVLLKFRQLLGKEQDIRTIQEIVRQQDDDAVFGSMCCFYVSFLIVSKDLNEAQSLFERWANDYCLRLPISIEVLRRQAPGDTNHFPKSALDWNNEMCRDLIGRLESSSDSKFAEMNALAASLLGDERAEDKYFGKLKDVVRFKRIDDEQSSFDKEIAYQRGIEVGWDNVKRKSRENPRTSFLKVMNENIVIRTLRTRGKQRVINLEIKEQKEKEKLAKYHDYLVTVQEPTIQVNLPERNLEEYLEKIRCRIKNSYRRSHRIANFISIVDACIKEYRESGELPDNRKLAQVSGKSLRTVERFWRANKEHGWLDRAALKK